MLKNYLIKKEFENNITSEDAGILLSKNGIEDFAKTFAWDFKTGTFCASSCYGALVALPLGKTLHLYELSALNFQPEIKTKDLNFVSMGSGQNLADPFLGFIKQVFWLGQLPTRSQGIFATTWAIQHAIDLNVGGINAPIQLAVLSLDKNGAPKTELLSQDQIDDHMKCVNEAKKHLAQFNNKLSDEFSKDIPKL